MYVSSNYLNYIHLEIKQQDRAKKHDTMMYHVS